MAIVSFSVRLRNSDNRTCHCREIDSDQVAVSCTGGFLAAVALLLVMTLTISAAFVSIAGLAVSRLVGRSCGLGRALLFGF